MRYYLVMSQFGSPMTRENWVRSFHALADSSRILTSDGNLNVCIQKGTRLMIQMYGR